MYVCVFFSRSYSLLGFQDTMDTFLRIFFVILLFYGREYTYECMYRNAPFYKLVAALKKDDAKQADLYVYVTHFACNVKCLWYTLFSLEHPYPFRVWPFNMRVYVYVFKA